MSDYFLTRPAAQDIDDILEYISAQSPKNALLVAERFERTFERIAHMPGIGHVRAELRDKNARVLTVSGFLVIYDATLSPIHILRVVRAARKLTGIGRLRT